MYATAQFDEHPPYGSAAGKPVLASGMQWTVDRVTQIAKSSLWGSTAIFITWDDWGGWFDHVDAPLKDTWKNGGPSGSAYLNTQFSYGPRVGCLVLGPYAKKGYISHAFHSHVSLVKFCETTFGVPALNARDAASDDMADCFDFTQAPLLPPASLSVQEPQPKRHPKPRPNPKSNPRY